MIPRDIYLARPLPPPTSCCLREHEGPPQPITPEWLAIHCPDDFMHNRNDKFTTRPNEDIEATLRVLLDRCDRVIVDARGRVRVVPVKVRQRLVASFRRMLVAELQRRDPAVIAAMAKHVDEQHKKYFDTNPEGYPSFGQWWINQELYRGTR